MPEVQTSQQSGEMTQRFIAFVMMQAQQIALFLGQIPHPQTGKAERNLEAARMFIDQLEMIREKTRGNLTKEEEEILRSVLADLQLAFVNASSETTAPAEPPAPVADEAPKVAATTESPEESESKKRFSKSYGG